MRQEHSALVVSGKFGSKTSQLFKNLSRGTTNLDERQLDSLLKAVQITSNDPSPSVFTRGRGRGRNFNGRYFNNNQGSYSGYNRGHNPGYNKGYNTYGWNNTDNAWKNSNFE